MRTRACTGREGKERRTQGTVVVGKAGRLSVDGEHYVEQDEAEHDLHDEGTALAEALLHESAAEGTHTLERRAPRREGSGRRGGGEKRVVR
jgi:hypothetical protein